MHDWPQIGIVIPCHNYGHWVSDAINSVVQQQYPKDKMFISMTNDGSSDDSYNVIKRCFDGTVDYDKYDGNSRISGTISGIRASLTTLSEPTGPSNARNVAIQQCIDTVHIIAFLDADDVMVPTKLQQMFPVLMSPGIGAVYADYETYNTETGVIIREFKEPFDKLRFLQENIGPNNTSLVTAQALRDIKDENGYFDRTMRTCEDYDLFMRVSSRYLIVHLPYCLTILKVQPMNSTNSVSEARWRQDRQRVFEKVRNKNAQ